MQNSRVHVGQGIGDTGGFRGKPSPTITLNGTRGRRAKGVKRVERGHRMTGRVVRILHGQSHGFIRAEDNRQLFFHRSDVLFALFNALAVRDRVAFEVIEDNIAGPRAVNVKRVAIKKRAR
jgi:cold shock CspA family protein